MKFFHMVGLTTSNQVLNIVIKRIKVFVMNNISNLITNNASMLVSFQNKLPISTKSNLVFKKIFSKSFFFHVAWFLLSFLILNFSKVWDSFPSSSISFNHTFFILWMSVIIPLYITSITSSFGRNWSFFTIRTNHNINYSILGAGY